PIGEFDRESTATDWNNVSKHSTAGLLPQWQSWGDGSDLQWQLRPWLETVGPHLGDAGARLADLDPTGRFLGVLTEADAKVIELETGRITHSIPAPTGSRWHTIVLSASAERVVLSDTINFMVRDQRNRIVSQWSLFEHEGYRRYATGKLLYTNLTWVIPGESLLLFGDEYAFVTDVRGNLIQELVVPQGFRLSQYSRVDFSPDGKQAILLCSDSRLLHWDLTSNTAEQFGKSVTDTIRLSTVRWSPDGRLLACSGWQQDLVVVVIVNTSGEIQHQFTSAELVSEEMIGKNISHPMAFAWSPDSKSLAFDNGRLMNIDGSVIRDLDISVVDTIAGSEYSGSRSGTSPFWRNIGRIDFVGVGPGTPSNAGHLESFSPTGQKLKTHRFGNLLRPQGALRTRDDGRLTIGYHQGRSHAAPERIITVTPSGDIATSVAVPPVPNIGFSQVVCPSDGRICRPGFPLTIHNSDGTIIGEYQIPQGWDYCVAHCSFSSSGKDLAVQLQKDGEQQIVILDGAVRERARIRLPFYPASVIAWSPNERYLGCTWNSGERVGFAIWDIDAPETPLTNQEIPPRTGTVNLGWSPDSRQLAVICQETNDHLRIYRPESNETLAVPYRRRFDVNATPVVWLNSSRLLLGEDLFEIPVERSEILPPSRIFAPLSPNVDSIYATTGTDEFLVARRTDTNVSGEFWRDGEKQGETDLPLMFRPWDLSDSKVTAAFG
ncbi:MAG: WD40 repeat domain-containing protein, partial [Planctomycetaceae bacterium]|nr:WD40 repeat domain-containing protein [Planctomycetaceae bacterium]